MKKAIAPLLVLAAAVGVFVLLGGAKKDASGTTYWIELDNAFGLTQGGDVKVGGVKAGKVTKFGLTPNNSAKIQVKLTQPGFTKFTDKATCDTRPQSVIGEYFIDCQPGKGKPLKSGGVVPVSRTTGTIPIDLVQNVLRLPYRERLSLIIGELGAGVAGNGTNLNVALRRAVPALRETDGLLQLLGDENQTIKALVRDGDTVIGDLARNKSTVVRFVRAARRTAELSAERRTALAGTFHRFPAFLQELRPTMVSLGKTADNTSKTLVTLRRSSGQLKTFFADAQPFADASKPALKSLGQASVTGRKAVEAAGPTVTQLRKFSKGTPELAGNLSTVLSALDDRNRAVETDPRAAVQLGTPGKKVGYTGLEALLMYVFNQSVAVNSYDQNGHLLRVNGFVSPCAAYVDTATRAQKIAANPAYARCSSYVGPTQPGINAPDTSDKTLIKEGKVNVNDGAPTGAGGLGSAPTFPIRKKGPKVKRTSAGPKKLSGAKKSASAKGKSDLPSTISKILGGARSKPKVNGAAPKAPSAPSPSDAQSLLDYLLAP